MPFCDVVIACRAHQPDVAGTPTVAVVIAAVLACAVVALPRSWLAAHRAGVAAARAIRSRRWPATRGCGR